MQWEFFMLFCMSFTHKNDGIKVEKMWSDPLKTDMVRQTNGVIEGLISSVILNAPYPIFYSYKINWPLHLTLIFTAHYR